jgi:hypothetical protein
MDMSDRKMNAIHNIMRQQRMEYKKMENLGKPPLCSADVEKTTDFVFSAPFEREGDSGKLLLAKRKTDRSDKYFVKHAFTDCACNEYVYTKLAQAMGYKMPDVVLFQLPDTEKRKYFKTEHIIGARYLNIIEPFPSYEVIRERATNWEEFFCFYGLYAMTGEVDGMESPLAEDGYIYRVDTTDAFPISNWDLDYAGVYQEAQGVVPNELIRQTLQARELSSAVDFGMCDFCLDFCIKKDAKVCKPLFLEPFQRIQEISDAYIDGFLNTLCYFYPDYIGDFFKRYIAALKQQSAEYIRVKR